MPVDCELLFGGNPQVFRSNSCTKLSDYRFANNVRNCLAQKMSIAIPLRPILTARPDVATDDGATSPTKLKKRVVFADEKGNPLTEIKWMTEPSNFPPKWDDDFVEQVTRGATATTVVHADKWEPTFTQPASDYVAFRTRLDEQCVGLENVIIKESEQQVFGTVKVRNLAFSKKVFVRVTFDAWLTHEDMEADHIPSPTAGTAVYELYDTFSFSFSIPPRAVKGQSLEFCVCFRCNEREYWDSNGGSNYKLMLTPNFLDGIVTQNGKTALTTPMSDGLVNSYKFEDALKAHFENWTEFSSWNHLTNNGPYW